MPNNIPKQPAFDTESGDSVTGVQTNESFCQLRHGASVWVIYAVDDRRDSILATFDVCMTQFIVFAVVMNILPKQRVPGQQAAISVI